MLFLAPTGLVMATLQMLDVKYAHWQFVWPVVAFVLTFGGAMLVLQVLILFVKSRREITCFLVITKV